MCIGGEPACPPEDCRGVTEYYNVLETHGRSTTQKDR
ncbi:MAG: hypothetical protein KAR19_18630 [Bacteroidales bacterium]|nr:hypothetical protein [Bacteroidales bacterium]